MLPAATGALAAPTGAVPGRPAVPAGGSMVMVKLRVLPPSVTAQRVTTADVNMGAEPGGVGAGAAAATAAAATAFFFSGSTILALPVSRRMPSLRSMFLPGTMAAATRKMVSSVTGSPRSSRAWRAGARLSGAASRGSPLKGSSFSCSLASLTTAGSGSRGVRPK